MLEAPIHHGKLVAVIVLIIAVLGVASSTRIPVQMIPDLDLRTVSVVTNWPGATPQDIENEILIEQERYLRSIPNLSRMVSLAETSQSVIELEFPFGVDMNETLIEITNALSQVPSYPENVDEPRLRSSSFSENAFMYFAIKPLDGNPLNLNMDMVTDYVEDYVRPRMERVRGVSEVSLRGGELRQVQIYLDPDKLAQRQISVSDVRDALRARNSDRSAGDIDAGKRRYLIRTIGRFQDLEQLEDMLIAHDNNTEIKLKDVARVELGHYEVRQVASFDGEKSLNLAVKREPGSNVIDIKYAMLSAIDEMQRDLLTQNGLQLELISDDARYVEGSVRNVAINLGLGGILATIVLFLFLRSPRATVIGLMGMPFCTLAALLGLMLFGRTINVISLAGIAFAIGMTVDNTIVVLESIEQARRRGLDRIEAATRGVKDVWTAILASSATTMLVFAPVLFVQEEAGQLYSDIAIAISTAIFASMLFALLVVPAACAYFGLGHMRGESARKPYILQGVEWLISSGFRRVVTIFGMFFVLMISAWQLMPPAEYLPEGEEAKAFSQMSPPPGYNLREMQSIAEEVEAIMVDALDADPTLFDRGEAPIPALEYYYMRVSPGGIRILSEPVRDDDIDAMMNSIVDIYEQYPGMRGFSSRGSIIASNQGGTRAVNLDISGPEMAALYTTADRAYRRAQTLFENTRVDSDPKTLTLDQPLIEVQPRWSRLAEVGFDADSFGYTVASLSDGAFVDEFFMDDRKVDIFLYSQAGQSQQLPALSQMPILTPSGDVLPLNALADLQETVDSDTLRRVDGQRTVSLMIIPPREVALETAVDVVRNQMIPEMQTEGEIEPGVTTSISGAADQLDATRESLSENIGVAVLLIYLVLVAIFAHWGYPLIILTTVPLGIAGGLLGLVAVNSSGPLLTMVGLQPIVQPFDMITMLGFIILLGTVVNNPILIVEQARRNLAHVTTNVEDAVKQAVETRLRPILMSTATTVLGLSPLVFSPGDGAELYRGVGIVVLIGIMASMIITLTFLPSLLIYILRFTHKSQHTA